MYICLLASFVHSKKWLNILNYHLFFLFSALRIRDLMSKSTPGIATGKSDPQSTSICIPYFVACCWLSPLCHHVYGFPFSDVILFYPLLSSPLFLPSSLYSIPSHHTTSHPIPSHHITSHNIHYPTHRCGAGSYDVSDSQGHETDQERRWGNAPNITAVSKICSVV